MKQDIQIYVACLASYNNGILHGRWIDATLGEDAIWDQINEVLKTSPIPDAEEWAIHDHEGFEGLNISEYEGIETVAEKAAFIEEHGTLGAEIAAHFGGDLDEARDALEDQYAGCYDSVEAFAEELTEQSCDIPERLQYYIDYERMADDLQISDIFMIETAYRECHIFWSR